MITNTENDIYSFICKWGEKESLNFTKEQGERLVEIIFKYIIYPPKKKRRKRSFATEQRLKNLLLNLKNKDFGKYGVAHSLNDIGYFTKGIFGKIFKDAVYNKGLKGFFSKKNIYDYKDKELIEYIDVEAIRKLL